MTGEIACGSALSSSLTRSTTIALWDAVQDGSPGCHSEYPTVPSSERCTSAETSLLMPPLSPTEELVLHKRLLLCRAQQTHSKTAYREVISRRTFIHSGAQASNSLFLQVLLPAWSRQYQYLWCPPAKISLDPLSCSFAFPCLLTVLEDFQS